MVIPDPRTAIDDAIAKFDSEEATVEDTVRALLAAFPNNREFTHVYLKGIGINQFLSGTRPEHRR
jgi:hypothetical protein